MDNPIKPVILRYLRDELAAGDQTLLDEWLAASAANKELLAELEDVATVGEVLARLDRLKDGAAWERFHEYVVMRKGFAGLAGNDAARGGWRGVGRWLAAAVVIGLLGLGIWVLVGPRSASKHLETVNSLAVRDVAAPSRSRATLTLGNGRRLDLDSAASGAVAMQGSAQVVKGADGRLTYQTAGPLTHDQLLYNTLDNPRGSQVVNLVLADGTHVWLNAESSIRYPAVFVGDERTVTITGEAYLEVAPDASKPFRVVAGAETIDVLGTAFNINVYPDESRLRTTLVDGKVRVSAAGYERLLQPGQQVTCRSDGSGLTLAPDPDLEQVLAWKNGRFAFKSADLPTVMRELARWYNIEVSYEGNIPDRHFTGRIGKSLTLDQVLKGLTRARVNYRIEGRKLVIRP